jgi:hypothetical protein
MCQGDTGQTRPLNKNLGQTQDGLRGRLGSGNPNVIYQIIIVNTIVINTDLGSGNPNEIETRDSSHPRSQNKWCCGHSWTHNYSTKNIERSIL